jgi:hypothetical protein
VLRVGFGGRTRWTAVIVYGRLAVGIAGLLTEALVMVGKVRLVAGFIYDPGLPRHFGC